MGDIPQRGNTFIVIIILSLHLQEYKLQYQNSAWKISNNLK
jgi:hypothetical protein